MGHQAHADSIPYEIEVFRSQRLGNLHACFHQSRRHVEAMRTTAGRTLLGALAHINLDVNGFPTVVSTERIKPARS